MAASRVLACAVRSRFVYATATGQGFPGDGTGFSDAFDGRASSVAMQLRLTSACPSRQASVAAVAIDARNIRFKAFSSS
jgi:hypothetical protein